MFLDVRRLWQLISPLWSTGTVLAGWFHAGFLLLPGNFPLK
jgi:hypothetical protein